MANKADQLRKKFEDDLKKLQEECEHKFISQFMPHYWAAAHSSGFSAQYCLECNKMLRKEYWCRYCRKSLIDDEAKPGTGTHGHPLGPQYCTDCLGLTVLELHKKYGQFSGYNIKGGYEICSCGYKSKRER